MQSMKRRVLSMLLAVMMIVTIVPVQVSAEETHSHETSSVAQEIQAAIDAILTNYLGTTSMSQQEIQSVPPHTLSYPQMLGSEHYHSNKPVYRYMHQ